MGRSDLGPLLAGVPRLPPQTAEEEAALARGAQDGSKLAQETLVVRNLRLTAKIVREFEWTGADPCDLLQEGSVGLLRAIQKFDPAKGRFRPYAMWWIRAYVRRAATKNPLDAAGGYCEVHEDGAEADEGPLADEALAAAEQDHAAKTAVLHAASKLSPSRRRKFGAALRAGRRGPSRLVDSVAAEIRKDERARRAFGT